jgi:quaternary ammonium compound-resistance protein SugE
MPWLLLFVAGLLEICWAIGLKYSNGFSDARWAGFTLVTLAGSMYLLALALRALPVGTAYAVWTGVGAVGTAILGIILFDEPRSFVRLLCIALIVAGILGLRLFAREG